MCHGRVELSKLKPSDTTWLAMSLSELCHDTMFPHFGQKHFATKYESKTPFKTH